MEKEKRPAALSVECVLLLSNVFSRIIECVLSYYRMWFQWHVGHAGARAMSSAREIVRRFWDKRRCKGAHTFQLKVQDMRAHRTCAGVAQV